MSSGGVSDREVLHVATGAPACAVTAHWSNLQGLAGTSSSSVDAYHDVYDENTTITAAPPCAAAVTHGIYQQLRVPRALLIDEASSLAAGRQSHHHSLWEDQNSNDIATAVYTAGRPVQSLQYTEIDTAGYADTTATSFGDFYQLTEATTIRSLEQLSLQQQRQVQTNVDEDPYASAYQAASTLAYGPYSRYRVATSSGSSNQNQTSSAPVSYAVSSQNERHVNWDDDDNEEEPDNDDDDWLGEREREQIAQQQRQRRRRQDWFDNTYQPLQSQLDDYFFSFPSNNAFTTSKTGGSGGAENAQQQTSPATQREEETSMDAATTTKQQQQRHEQPHWMDYYMPPHHPESVLAWETGSSSESFMTELQQERLRTQLEACDACQGVVLTTTSFSGSSSPSSTTSADMAWWSPHNVTVAQLQYLQDECPAAQRWVVTVQDGAAAATDNNSSAASSSSWHTTTALHRVRYPVQAALAWQSYTELAHAILPLKLPSSNSSSAALVAAALECSSLPYRLNAKPSSSLVGMQAGHFYGEWSGELGFGTAPRLSVREWLGQLRGPSNQHVVLELDMMMMSNTTLPQPQQQTLETLLRRGTRLEQRDGRMRQRHGGGDPNVQPGAWMLAAAGDGGTSTTSNKGLLTCLSPMGRQRTKSKRTGNDCPHDDRSLHRHFSLAAALRPNSNKNPLVTTPEHYVTCLLDGLGRFRPEQSTGTVLQQSLQQLTTGGYGAGSYWKSIWSNNQTADTTKQQLEASSSSSMPTLANTTGLLGNKHGQQQQQKQTMPVLAVLGNTTRRYGHLDQMANEMKQALSPSQQLRGFYNRDVMQGALPELDDCQEALAACWDLRDAYTPPSQALQADGGGSSVAGFLDDL